MFIHYNPLVHRDKEMTEKIIRSLGLKVTPRDMRHKDPHVQLSAVTSQWLPLADAVLCELAATVQYSSRVQSRMTSLWVNWPIP